LSGVILFDPFFQGLAISLMAGEIAALLVSRCRCRCFTSSHSRTSEITRSQFRPGLRRNDVAGIQADDGEQKMAALPQNREGEVGYAIVTFVH